MSEHDPIVKKHSSLETPFGPRMTVKLWKGTLINGSNKTRFIPRNPGWLFPWVPSDSFGIRAKYKEMWFGLIWSLSSFLSLFQIALSITQVSNYQPAAFPLAKPIINSGYLLAANTPATHKDLNISTHKLLPCISFTIWMWGLSGHSWGTPCQNHPHSRGEVVFRGWSRDTHLHPTSWKESKVST